MFHQTRRQAETWTLAAGGLELELQASQGALQQGTVTWKPRPDGLFRHPFEAVNR